MHHSSISAVTFCVTLGAAIVGCGPIANPEAIIPSNISGAENWAAHDGRPGLETPAPGAAAPAPVPASEKPAEDSASKPKDEAAKDAPEDSADSDAKEDGAKPAAEGAAPDPAK